MCAFIFSRKGSLPAGKCENLSARIDNSLAVVILAAEHLRLLNEIGCDPVALDGLSKVLEDVCFDLQDVRDELNVYKAGE